MTKKNFKRPVVNGKTRNIRKEGLSVKRVAEFTGKTVESVLSMIN